MPRCYSRITTLGRYIAGFHDVLVYQDRWNVIVMDPRERTASQ
jgi:hypothetical protein